jgi:hypothetical protein
MVRFSLSFSFTPGFKPGVKVWRGESNRFNGFPDYWAMKTVETVRRFVRALTTRLKPGVNETEQLSN